MTGWVYFPTDYKEAVRAFLRGEEPYLDGEAIHEREGERPLQEPDQGG